MAGNHGGRGLAILALVIALIALALSIQTYRKVEGTRALQAQVHTLEGALDTLRKKTADALRQIAHAVRPPESAGPAAGRKP